MDSWGFPKKHSPGRCEHWATSIDVFRAAHAAASAPPGFWAGEESWGMQWWMVFWGGCYLLHVRIYCWQCPGLPAGHGRGIREIQTVCMGLVYFGAACRCLAESKGQALILQMVFIKLNKKKKERTRNYNYSLFNAAVWKGLDSAHKSGVRLCRFVNVLGTFCIFQDVCVEKKQGYVKCFSSHSTCHICTRHKSKVPWLFSWVATTL